MFSGCSVLAGWLDKELAHFKEKIFKKQCFRCRLFCKPKITMSFKFLEIFCGLWGFDRNLGFAIDLDVIFLVVSFLFFILVHLVFEVPSFVCMICFGCFRYFMFFCHHSYIIETTY